MSARGTGNQAARPVHFRGARRLRGRPRARTAPSPLRRDEDALHRAAADLVDALVLVTDLSGALRSLNARASEWIASSGAPVIGRPFWSAFGTPVERAALRALFQRHTRTRDKGRFEACLTGPDGARAKIEWRFAVADSGPDRVVALTGRDVTRYAAAEEMLGQARLLLRNLLDSMDGPAWSASGAELTYVNPAAERLTGYPPEALLARRGLWLRLVHPEDRARVRAEIASLAEAPVAAFETRVVRRDGAVRWLQVRLSATRSEGGPLRVDGTATDVTGTKDAERSVARDRELARQAQKLESIGRLACGIAHDFNNMLTVVNGYSDLLMHAVDADDPLFRYLREIRLAGQQASRLTRQLLGFGRPQALPPEAGDLRETVRSLQQMLGRLIGERVDFVTLVDNHACPVEARPGFMEQVLMNLALNARDAMPTGGTLVVDVRNRDLRADLQDEWGLIPAGPWVVLEVCDTGCGMDEQTLSRVFQPFFTTKGAGEGTGLGLATVYEIIRHSGGHIRVYSRPGRGTTFQIHLPRAARPLPGALALVEGPLPEGEETILLVEDDPQVRGVARDILQLCGYSVFEAADGLEAWRWFQQYCPKLDLLLTDIRMPELDGPELARRIQDRSRARVLYTSGYAQPDQPGAPEAAVLEKPFTAEALAHRVRAVLGGRSER